MKLARRGRVTLFAQVFALVLAAVVGAEGINLWIVWHLPPPAPAFYTEADVMRALRGQSPIQRQNAIPPLFVRHETQPPPIESEARIGFLGFRDLMAKDLGLTRDDIVVTTENRVSAQDRSRLICRNIFAAVFAASQSRMPELSPIWQVMTIGIPVSTAVRWISCATRARCSWMVSPFRFP